MQPNVGGPFELLSGVVDRGLVMRGAGLLGVECGRGLLLLQTRSAIGEEVEDRRNTHE